MILGTSLASCDTSADVEASGADGSEKSKDTEVKQDHDTETSEISIGNVSFFLDHLATWIYTKGFTS